MLKLTKNRTRFNGLALILSQFFFVGIAQAKICEYHFTVWNTKTKSSDGPFTINKDYKDLKPSELGPLGCTPCEIDQKEIILDNKMKVKICIKLAGPLLETLNQILKLGYPLESILGYRPSISKGIADASGRRTELSNHAFGTAIDLNENYNGLYVNCLQWSSNCRLQKAGIYRPGHPLSLTMNSVPVLLLKKIGLKWGGEISGKQKDFMHFSPTGY